jgi:type IV pilus assembly protein PilB
MADDKKSSSSIEDLLSNKGNAKMGGTQPADDDSGEEKKDKKKGLLEEEISAGVKLDDKLQVIHEKDIEAETSIKAQELGHPHIDLFNFPINQEALQLIPEDISIKEKMVAFLFTGENIRIGTTKIDNPEVEKIAHALAEAQHSKSEVYLISKRSLKKALDIYAKMPRYRKPVAGVEISEDELTQFTDIVKNFKALQGAIEKVNTTELVTLITAGAVQSGASDIHVEAEERGIAIRYRVDGMLHDAAEVEKKKWDKIIARIKLVSKLKVNIDDKPQDGRFSIILNKEKIDVRVSILPTTWGESVVMRLLKPSSIDLGFDKLGLTGTSFEKLKAESERPNGMIITTGPTGSGKTTTLYAVLNKLNKEETKIITLEDPIEYKVKGLNQSQIDHSKGYTFADGLKSMLRQDPDIVMVGEMRDLETADTAINAALTGHLVISTIHTNSAAGAVPRFLAMGVKPFLLAPALNAIMGQRLVRRVCEECKEEYTLKEETLKKVDEILGKIPEDHPDRPDLTKMKFTHGKGCDACVGLGYKGRIGIYEIMKMDKSIEDLILNDKVSEYDMEEIAIKNGMITMVQDGLIKALKGETTVEEVFRVSE